MSNNSHKELHLIESFLPFYMLLAQYRLAIVDLGTVGLIIIALCTLYRHTWRVKWHKWMNSFGFFMIFVLGRDIIKLIIGIGAKSVMLNRMIDYLIIFLLIFIICGEEFNEKQLYKTWKIAGVIYSAALFVQIFSNYLLGHVMSPISIIPGYELRTVEQLVNARPSSFFAEPAAYVTAMFPLLFMTLKKCEYKWAIFTTVAICISTSTVGVVLSIVLWGIFLLGKRISKNKKVMGLIIAFILIVIFLNNDVFLEARLKLFEVLKGGSTVSSRITCGLETIKTLDWHEWIFGTNYNEVENYIADNAYRFSIGSTAMLYFTSTGKVFLNTFSEVIFRYGILGLGVFLVPLIREIISRESDLNSYASMITVAIFVQSMLLNSIYFMIVMIFLLYRQKALFQSE